MAEYKNWKSGKKVPQHMAIYRDFVIPEDVEIFIEGMPDVMVDNLRVGDVIYMIDGTGYDIFNHKYVDA